MEIDNLALRHRTMDGTVYVMIKTFPSFETASVWADGYRAAGKKCRALQARGRIPHAVWVDCTTIDNNKWG